MDESSVRGVDGPPPMPLTFRVAFPRDDTATLVLLGDLDHTNAADLDETLDAIAIAGATQVVVDAHGVSFVDRAAMLVLQGRAEAFRAAGGRLTVVNPSWVVLRLARLLALEPTLAPERGW